MLVVVRWPHEGGWSVVFCFWKEKMSVLKTLQEGGCREVGDGHICSQIKSRALLSVFFNNWLYSRNITSERGGSYTLPTLTEERCWCVDNICGDTVHFTEAGTRDVTSCPRWVAADWWTGRARFDKRMSGAADRDQAWRHETMVLCPVPIWKRLKAALQRFLPP